jgi:hypothetical protein
LRAFSTPQTARVRGCARCEGLVQRFPKLMQVFVSIDSMVGADYEAGLKNLKALAEK